MKIGPSRHNLAQQLTHTLGEAIVQGKYTADLGLPSEADLCNEYDIGRSTTREAVKMLTAKGLIFSRPRLGIRIQPRVNWNMLDPDVLNWILKGTPTLKFLKEILQLRIAIEPEAAALAADNQDEEKIELIGDALEKMKRADTGIFDPLEATITFHLSILAACGNPFYMQLFGFIESALRVSIQYTNQIKSIDSSSYKTHKKIYEAIVKGNPQSARNISRDMQAEALELVTGELEGATTQALRQELQP